MSAGRWSSSAPARPASPRRSRWPAPASAVWSSTAAEPARANRVRPWSACAPWSCSDPGESRTGYVPAATTSSGRCSATPTLAEAASGQVLEVGYPTPQQSAVLSPTAPACVPQDHLETVLLDHLRELPAAEVWLDQVVEQVQQDQHVVAVEFRDRETGARRNVLADYVIGADGARSAVRSSVGIGRQSTERLVESLSVLFHAPLWEVVGEHRFGIYSINDPSMPASFLPGRAWRPLALRLRLGSGGGEDHRLHRRPIRGAHPGRRRDRRPADQDRQLRRLSRSSPRSPTGSATAGSSSPVMPRTR